MDCAASTTVVSMGDASPVVGLVDARAQAVGYRLGLKEVIHSSLEALGQRCSAVFNAPLSPSHTPSVSSPGEL